MSDPLSQPHRQRMPAQTIHATSYGQARKRSYEAYDRIGKPCPYTEIRCVLQPSQALQSRFFLAAVFSKNEEEELFTLIYSFMAIEVRGHNLKEMRRALQSGCCEYIQEFHEHEFLPPHSNQPVIDSIRFITGEKLDDILASHKAGK